MPPAPTCPGSDYRAGEGLASFLGGLGVPSRRTPMLARRVPAEVLRPRSVPYRVPSRRTWRVPDPGSHQSELWQVPVRSSFARRLRFRRTSEESGIGLRLTLLPRLPFHRFRGLRPEGHCPLRRWPKVRNFLPLPEVRSSLRNATMTRSSESRQAESRPRSLWITGISWISRRPRRRRLVRGPAGARSGMPTSWRSPLTDPFAGSPRFPRR